MKAPTLVALSALIALPAAAQPAPPADPPAPVEAEAPACGVTIVRAPDDVRAAVIQGLLDQPGACAGALQVWIVPTGDGLYVQARDRAGVVRERVVPDEAVAATLLASWVDIDTTAAPPPPAPAAEPAPAVAVATPATTPPAAVEPVHSGTTGSSRTFAAPIIRAQLVPSPRRSYAAEMVAVHTGSGMSGAGVRVGIDGPSRGRWRSGIAAVATHHDGDYDVVRGGWMSSSYGIEESARDSFDLLATLGYAWHVGPVSLIPGVGLGIGAAEHRLAVLSVRDDSWRYDTTTYSVGARGEAGIVASVPLAARWQLEVAGRVGVATFSDVDGTEASPLSLDGINAVSLGLRFRP